MLSITVTLLRGTIRAGSPDDTVLVGNDPAGEWPPSPARLFSALVAGDGTGQHCTRTDGEELRWLEALDPPVIHASAPSAVEQTPLLPRYAVVDKATEGTVQEYPARMAEEVRPGIRMCPEDPAVIYCWAGEVSHKHLAALRYRAARVGYLGCSDSPIRITVEPAPLPSTAEVWEPDPTGSVTLPVPYRGLLDCLDEAYDRWSAGEAMRRAWLPTRRARYRPPRESVTKVPTSRRVIWLRFGRSVSGRNLLLVTSTLRSAVTEQLQRLLGEVPALVHGHRSEGETGPQVDFLALPDVGQPYASGRLLGAAISLPATERVLAERVLAAVFRVSREGLVCPERFQIPITVYGGEPKPWGANPERWTRAARRWVSVTPVVHERWSRRAPGPEEATRWCVHAGIRAPSSGEAFVTAVESSRRGLVRGALDLPPALVFRAGRERRPYSHMRLTFSRPVEGPVVLGRCRQLGFGLFAPERDSVGV
jgi:CRISPR-associated protein Csb2